MNDLRKHLSTCLLATAALLGGASPAWAQVSLGAASGFSVLGATVTCTTSVIVGDVGISPATAFTNTGCTIAGGMPPATNAAAVGARTDFLSAYDTLQSMTCSPLPALTPSNLAGANLPPGTYCLDAVEKAGTLTLTGPSNGVWIFLVNGALTGTNFSVVMAGGGQPCNVFWAPTGGVTMTTSALKGNILAGAPATAADPGSITLSGGSLAGRALATVAVTMTDASVIGCAALSVPAVCKDKDHDGDHEDKDHKKCDKDSGKHSEDCDSDHSDRHRSKDEHGDKSDHKGDHK